MVKPLSNNRNRPLRILMVTLAPWDINNVTGSTASSIFSTMKDVEIYNIFCRPGKPNNDCVKAYFQITDQMLLTALKSGKQAGRAYMVEPSVDGGDNHDVFTSNRSRRWQIFYWAEELLWLNHRWQSKALDGFINKINPDIIWAPIYYRCFMNRLNLYLHAHYHIPLVSFISDDNYTLHQFSLSPLYWIDRFIKRPVIKKVIEQSSDLFVISEAMKDEYDRLFGVDSKVITKGGVFDECPNACELKQPYRLTYIGGLGYNRWKSLVEIGKTIEEINGDNPTSYVLDVYSNAVINDHIKQALGQYPSMKFHGSINQDAIGSTYQNSQLLVHVEPNDLKHRLFYRLSFSTKLVDYFQQNRAILAYGGTTGSLDYLQTHDCAFVAHTQAELKTILLEILKDPKRLHIYGKKAFTLGERKHQQQQIVSLIHTTLINDATKGD